MRQPEHAIGLQVARSHRRKRVVDYEVDKLVTSGSADINAVSKALNAGASLEGSTTASFLVGPEIAEHLIR